MKNLLPAIALAAFTVAPAALSAAGTPDKPNVIVLIADDLGYGDISCYGAKTIKTPNIDALAKNGLRFTRGYAASATSSPSRYALLTGVYPWRHKVAILPGNAPLLIPTDRPTIATMFGNAGYETAAIGKWHLGLGSGNTDWNKPIKPGPSEIGFKHSYIMAATNDRVPCVYFSNGSVVGLDPNDPIEVSYRQNFDGEPTGRSNPEMLKLKPSHGHADSIVAGVSRIGFMKGGQKARWNDAEMANVFSREALSFISGAKKANKPFFLYYALHQPHVPRVPNPKFAGKSGLGPRGDVILEADAQVGELTKFLRENGLDRNTVIVFTSDNGPVLDDGYQDQAVPLAKKKGHSPTGALRGGKYSLFEGGTRVPFIVTFPSKVRAGTVSDVPVAQLDLYASFAKMLNKKMPEYTDSLETLDTLFGKNGAVSQRKDFVIEADGRLAYRAGDWVFIPPYRGGKYAAGNETGSLDEPTLYKIMVDVGQRENAAAANPEKLAEMQAAFEIAKRKK